PTLDPKQLVNYIISHYAYPGLKGLIAVGIASMAMSTADSELNASAVLVVNDIIKPLKKDFKESLLLIRIFSLSLGLLGLLLALRTTDLLDLLLLAGSFWMPVVTVPLLLAIFGFRSSSRAVLIGMTAGFTVVCLGRMFNLFGGLDPLIPGMIANLIFYMGSHYLLGEQGGWIGIAEKTSLVATSKKGENDGIQVTIPTKTSVLYGYIKRAFQHQKLAYIFSGLYIIGATYTAFIFTTDYQSFYLFV